MRLRTRLLLSVTAVTTAVLAASFVPLYVLIDAAETRDLDHALLRLAYASAQRLPSSYPAGQPLDAGWVRVPESLEPTTRYLAAYDAAGQVLAASASFAGEAPTLEELGVTDVSLEGTPLDVSVGETVLRGVVMPVPGRSEFLLYAASQRTIDDDTQYLWRVLLLLFVCAALATSLLARWVGERLARDVHAIAGVARAVAEGNLDARVHGDARGSDETLALAADLDHMISQLSELVRSQRTFISHAAHELRSPLATLHGELQLALRRPREADAYRAALEEMRGDVETLVRLTEDLLLLARLQAGAAPLPSPTRVESAVHEALRMARGLAEERGVQVRATGLADIGEVEVPSVRGGELARLLRNLIDNAISHSPRGGVVEVAVRVGSRLELAVSDAGPGVAPEDRPHIFAPFYRGAHETPEHPAGAGLGLSIARAIAQGVGGDLALDESYTAGARFVVSLPRTGSAAA